MFFYISGMAMTFYNTEGKGFGVFLGEKSIRLVVPFVLAIFIFLIPRLYFG
jgi:fucose 4-O-acetylase-like acetyltransferase